MIGKDTKIADVMRENLYSLGMNSSLYEAIEYMNVKKIGAITVVENFDVVGIFSERDLLTRVVLNEVNLREVKLEDYMTKSVTTVKADTPAEDALYLMVKKNIRHLPVIDSNGTPVGMLGIRDLLREFLGDNISHLIDQIQSRS